MNTQSGRILFAAGLITAALASGAIAQQDEKLGKVVFPTSCDPNVQAEFDRGVAMLHSYWFLIARRTFEGIVNTPPPKGGGFGLRLEAGLIDPSGR